MLWSDRTVCAVKWKLLVERSTSPSVYFVKEPCLRNSFNSWLFSMDTVAICAAIGSSAWITLIRERQHLEYPGLPHSLASHAASPLYISGTTTIYMYALRDLCALNGLYLQWYRYILVWSTRRNEVTDIHKEGNLLTMCLPFHQHPTFY